MKTVRCLKCGALYPIDMEMCPSCNTKNSVENIKRIDDTKGQTRAQGYWSTSQVKSITCCMCGKQAQWNNGLYRCECGAKFDNSKKIVNLNSSQKSNGTSAPTVSCPYCHSTNTKKITSLSKAGSVALWGVFALGKTTTQWHCNNCKSDF